MAAIESVRDAQNRRKGIDGLAIGFVQRGIVFVALLGLRAAMVARHVSDHLTLRLRKSRQFRVPDEVERMLMMRLVSDVITGVVQKRRRRQKGSVMSVQHRQV